MTARGRRRRQLRSSVSKRFAARATTRPTRADVAQPWRRRWRRLEAADVSRRRDHQAFGCQLRKTSCCAQALLTPARRTIGARAARLAGALRLDADRPAVSRVETRAPQTRCGHRARLAQGRQPDTVARDAGAQRQAVTRSAAHRPVLQAWRAASASVDLDAGEVALAITRDAARFRRALEHRTDAVLQACLDEAGGPLGALLTWRALGADGRCRSHARLGDGVADQACAALRVVTARDARVAARLAEAAVSRRDAERRVVATPEHAGLLSHRESTAPAGAADEPG